MKHLTITCDACTKDLTTTDAMPAFRLALTPESLPHVGNTRYAVHIEPWIKREHHFCNPSCLSNWLDKTFPKKPKE